jgi:hypothetical protein
MMGAESVLSRSRRRFIGTCLAVGVIAMPLGYAASAILGVPRSLRTPAGILLGAAVSAALALSVRRGIRAVEQLTLAVLPLHRKDATPPVSISQVQTLVARGDAEGASAMFDDLLAKHGYDEELSRAAVEFHLSKGGSPSRAAEMLRSMRAADPARHERFATQRLIDIYLGPLAEPQRALPELRRMADRFPNTSDAAGALDALQRLKANGLPIECASREV